MGLPFAFYNLGIPLGLIITITICILTEQSCHLYLEIMLITPGYSQSLYELGYIIAGRKTIFYISLVIGLNSFGLMMIYFIIFADSASSLSHQIFESKNIFTS